MTHRIDLHHTEKQFYKLRKHISITFVSQYHWKPIKRNLE